MNLPKLKIWLELPNPDYKLHSDDPYYGVYEVDCEVIQLNLSSGTMRVRYFWWNANGKMAPRCSDYSNEPFFKQYTINKL